MTENTAKSFFKPGWEWPTSIIAFFLLLTVINSWVLFQGFTKAGSMVEDGAYEKGLKYQETIDKLSAIERLGWQVDFSVEGKREAGRIVTVRLRQADNIPLSGANVTVKALRPADAASDTAAELKESSPGEFQAVLPLRENGLWYFEIAIRVGSHEGMVKVERML